MNKMMHKWLALLMALIMLLSVCPLAMAEGEDAAAAEPTATVEDVAGEVAEATATDWTVMVYLCGTDLESTGAMATINLVEIAETIPNDNVNVVIETGGPVSGKPKSTSA